MSATQAHLAELNRIRAERASQVQAQQQGQQQPQQKNPGAAGAVGNVAGTGAGLAAGNYVSGAMAGGSAAGAGTAGAAGAGVGSGSVAVGGSAAPVISTTALPSVSAVGGGASSGAAAAPAAGAGTMALGAAGAIAYLKNLYDMGGDKILAGKGDKQAYVDTYVNAIPMFAGFNRLGAKYLNTSAGTIGGGGKGGDQSLRDIHRNNFQGMGLTDDNDNLTTAFGNKFNIGLDGHGRILAKDGTAIPGYNVDASNPFAHQATAWMDPIIEIITGGDVKARSDFTGFFTNAAMSDAQTLEGVRANVMAFMEKSGVNFADAPAYLDKLLAAGKIDQARKDAYLRSLSILQSGNSKEYDTRTVQQVQAEAAAAVPPTPPPVPTTAAGLPVPGPVSTLPLVVPPGTLPSAKGAIPGISGVPRITPPPAAVPPIAAAAPPPSIAGQPPSAFQKLIDEAKKREQMSGARQ